MTVTSRVAGTGVLGTIVSVRRPDVWPASAALFVHDTEWLADRAP